jgi:glycosyltransferase involved in cell wall biosynthesis
LHLLVFLLIWWALFIFTIFPNVLDKIWSFFWVARWADALVYVSIIFLFYFVLLLLKKITENQDDMTFLIREFAVENSARKEIKWKEVFVIPVYNEESVILDTINSILKEWYKNILVVNDGSKDKSRKLLNSLWNSIIVLNHMKNRWQWAALETGFEYIRRYWDVDFVITFDWDWQHNIKDLQNFYDIANKNKDVDIFLGSRFLNKNNNIPLLRKTVLKLWIFFTYIVSGIKLTDTHNWYRVIRKKILNKIRITQDGMSHASEIIDIISVKKIKFKEVPVNIQYTQYSLKKWQKSLNAINIAFRTIWNKFFR